VQEQEQKMASTSAIATEAEDLGEAVIMPMTPVVSALQKPGQTGRGADQSEIENESAMETNAEVLKSAEGIDNPDSEMNNVLKKDMCLSPK
jgi:DhnA family fructose-bisphosphate aldolase class Ia